MAELVWYLVFTTALNIFKNGEEVYSSVIINFTPAFHICSLITKGLGVHPARRGLLTTVINQFQGLLGASSWQLLREEAKLYAEPREFACYSKIRVQKI